uniref:Uncharacterized protein n=1 Tax=viral metagenome TaxID=1070528 RepID=A0A6C0BN52_9ZZZZ
MIELIIIFLILVTYLTLIAHRRLSVSQETFTDQTRVPTDQPDTLDWDFHSPKSAIQNFNETTDPRSQQDVNQPKGYNSHQFVDQLQPVPTWVYPYTFINRQFTRILTHLVHQIEKDYNRNARLHERNNQEWRQITDYREGTWDQIDDRIKQLILDIMEQINRRFNLDVPIVEFRRDHIRYHWVSATEVFIILSVYKKYTITDIKYLTDIDPNINQHLKMNFEQDLLIGLDDLDFPSSRNSQHNHSSHIKYLRLPQLNYEQEDIWDDLPYVHEYDTRFYLAKSKDPMYRFMNNTEARDAYIAKINKDKLQTQSRCFPSQLTPQTASVAPQDPLVCDQENGLWDHPCQSDNECPYYQKNQNYPNTWGGCNRQTGYCQMPINVKPLTFHTPANPQDAPCYNCPKGNLGPNSIGPCCQQQVRPDYAFENDLSIRHKNAEILKQQNQKWSAY